MRKKLKTPSIFICFRKMDMPMFFSLLVHLHNKIGKSRNLYEIRPIILRSFTSERMEDERAEG